MDGCLTWHGTSRGAEVLRPWLALLADPTSTALFILPFVRAGAVTGWYAVARTPDRSDELRDIVDGLVRLHLAFALRRDDAVDVGSSSRDNPERLW